MMFKQETRQEAKKQLQIAINSARPQLVYSILILKPSLSRESSTYQSMCQLALKIMGQTYPKESDLQSLEVLYAFVNHPLPTEREVYDIVELGAQPEMEAIHYSDEIKAIFSQEANSLKEKWTDKIPVTDMSSLQNELFTIAQQKMFILTGEQAVIYDGLITTNIVGKHLRFGPFPSTEDENIQKLMATLHWFDFSFQPVQKSNNIFITFSRDNFIKLEEYFSGTRKPSPTSNLTPIEKGLLYDFLLSPSTSQKFDERNSFEYDLEPLKNTIARTIASAWEPDLLTFDQEPCSSSHYLSSSSQESSSSSQGEIEQPSSHFSKRLRVR